MNLIRYFIKYIYMNGQKFALHFTCNNFILSYVMISPNFPVVLCPVFKKMNTFLRKASADYYLHG